LTLDGFVSSSRRSSVISEEELMDIRALSRQGYTYAEIGRLLGRDWRTVKRYLEEGAQPVYCRKRMPSKLDGFKPLIDQWLAKEPRLLATRVHQDSARDYGFEGSYNTVRRYVERSLPKPPARSEVRLRRRRGFRRRSTGLTSSRSAPARGWSCRSTASTWSSATRAIRFAGSQDLVTFWACHRAAFTHFGGVPHELLYDPTKTVVRQHVGRDVTLEERIFHPEALASAHHCGFSMRLCQAYRAQTKGKVEHDVSYVPERLLRGHGFTSYEQANIAWLSWNEEITRQRVHGTHGEIVAVRAERDRTALLPLPPTSYLVVERTRRLVARDGFFSFEGRRYHVPDGKPSERAELVLGAQSSKFTRCLMAAGWHATSADVPPGSCQTPSRTQSPSPRSSLRSRIPRFTAGRFSL
jgi:transposase